MPYGIDTEGFEYITDAHGKRTKCVMPVATANALIEFWCAARRAQSDAIEQQARPGLRPAPLRVMTLAAPPDDEPPPIFEDERWRKLTEHLPDAPPSEEAPAATSSAPSPRTPKTKRIFFAREFVAPIPEEVAALIARGVYFIRAWRTYRGLTVQDVAELIGKTRDAAGFHEYGYNAPSEATLRALADAFDCSLDQLTVKPKSNTSPWLDVIEGKPDIEPRSPEGTDYPDPVLAHLLDGKSPLTAWRLHRKMTLAQLAGAYGTGSSAIKSMEEARYLKPKVIEKLCSIFRCKPAQLLRPEGMEYMKPAAFDHAESPASRRITEAMCASA
jgi:transcriptional regulator with XRE-family HTH domain